MTASARLIQDVSEAHAERYEEQILSVTRGNLRIRLRFSDEALLEISEAIVFIDEELRWLSYRYHYQDSSKALVFRYDNAPLTQRSPPTLTTNMQGIAFWLAPIPLLNKCC